MEQKLYKTVNSAGISSIVTGIIAVVAGLACVAGGILALIQGGRLLGGTKEYPVLISQRGFYASTES